MSQPAVRYYEDVELGDELGTLEKDISDDVVEAFCRVRGTPSPNRFTDPEQARKDGLSAPIVPGIMSMAMMAQLLTDWSTGGGVKDLDVVFRQPVLHQSVAITGVVTDKREEDGDHIVECDVELSDGERGRLIGGKAVISLPSRAN